MRSGKIIRGYWDSRHESLGLRLDEDEIVAGMVLFDIWTENISSGNFFKIPEQHQHTGQMNREFQEDFVLRLGPY